MFLCLCLSPADPDPEKLNPRSKDMEKNELTNHGPRLVFEAVVREALASLHEDIIQKIMRLVFEQHIRQDDDDHIECDDDVKFPVFTGINVNMMPIEVGYLKYPLPNLPTILQGYKSIISQCLEPQIQYAFDSHRKPSRVAYVTISETEVAAGETQRRPGVHIDRHNGISIMKNNIAFRPHYRWGRGRVFRWNERYTPQDGIYLANNIADSCQIFPCLIDQPELVTDQHGGISPCLASALPEPIKMKQNKVYWITDTTPHEALPIPYACKRQFFRLVVGSVSHWFSKHNTPNPNGVQPDCPIVDIDKFT